jgi:hypothetical protein
VTDAMINEFKTFMQEKKFTYKNQLEIELEGLEKTAKETDNSPTITTEINNFRQVIQKDKENDFAQSVDYIKRSIKRDILTRNFGESEVYKQIVLKTDPYVMKGVNILSSPKQYTSILEVSN